MEKYFPVIVHILIFFVNFSLSDSILPSLNNFVLSNIFCNDIMLPESITDYLRRYKNEIHGQPFVESVVFPSLSKHFDVDLEFKKSPSKPMILRFHGPAGVGKTFTADKILKADYFINKHHFSPAAYVIPEDPSSIEKYKKYLRKTIEKSVSTCKRSIFVFDDTHILPPDFFNDMPPFNAPALQKSLNFNESLFIYVAQQDSERIVSTTKKLLRELKSREYFDINKFMETLKSTEESIVSGLMKSYMDKVVNYWNRKPSPNFIEIYIPFLPLEPTHVGKCIKDGLKDIGKEANNKILRTVYHLIHCDPDDEFCTHGCKMVNSKVALAFDAHDEL